MFGEDWHVIPKKRDATDSVLSRIFIRLHSDRSFLFQLFKYVHPKGTWGSLSKHDVDDSEITIW